MSQEYILLFNSVTTALEKLEQLTLYLQNSQKRAEDLYISKSESDNL